MPHWLVEPLTRNIMFRLITETLKCTSIVFTAFSFSSPYSVKVFMMLRIKSYKLTKKGNVGKTYTCNLQHLG